MILFIAFACLGNSSIAQKKAVISGTMDFGSPEEVVSVNMLVNDGSHGFAPHNDTVFSQPLNQREFKFDIPINGDLAYVNINFYKRPYLLDELWFPEVFLLDGDSIFIHVNSHKEISFSGNAAKKFELIYQLSKLQYGGIKGFSEDPATYYKEKFAVLAQARSLIDQAAGMVDDRTLKLIEADHFGLMLGYIYQCFSFYEFGSLHSKAFGEIGLDIYKKYLYDRREQISDTTLTKSSLYFSNYLMHKEIADHQFDNLTKNTAYDPIDRLSSSFPPGILRDKILVNFLFYNKTTFHAYFYPALALVESQQYKTLFSVYERNFVMPTVPDQSIVLVNQHNEPVQLADLKGKIVLVDMWYTGCLPCIQVAKALPKVESAFRDRNDVVFVSLSIDKDKNKWLQSIDPLSQANETEGMNGQYFVSDHTLYWNAGQGDNKKNFTKRYNIFGTYPFLFLIDRQGRIVSRKLPRPEKEDGQCLIDVIKSYL